MIVFCSDKEEYTHSVIWLSATTFLNTANPLSLS